jgi:NAD(P)-dependent dehydrogenase (short-subunit alcohol dehydrogenase family)
LSAAEGSEARRSIFITGAASGIGRATARLFAERGWFVGAHDIDEAGLASLAAELGSQACLARGLDVVERADYDRAMAEFGGASEGRLDLLFNNAGIGAGGWFEEVPYDVARRVLDVNFIGVVNGAYAGAPLLARTPNSLFFSTVSSAAIFGLPRNGIYSASKFAVKGLTESLSVEFARFGSRAADVLPALVDTKILETAFDHSNGTKPGIAMKEAATAEGAMRLVQPEEVAEIVWEAYGSDRLHWYIPTEMENAERARAGSIEAMRDAFKKSVQEA